ncbi:MAG: Phosphatidylserine/phosphatidylglycerophosphate/ cardiolipinsynthase-like protein, partial [Parcubacteria group bacterium GW2011_GWA2_56_21]
MMRARLPRMIAALVLAFAAGGAGYTLGNGNVAAQTANVAIPAQTITAPPKDSVRVVYSLDKKQNDAELIALIDAAEDHIYFAIYTFTLPNIADALVAAKKRGVTVKGIVDSEQSRNSYGAPITEKLL